MFRLGIIYKQQGNLKIHLHASIVFPSPLPHADIWFQIGHIFEQQKNVSCFPFFLLTFPLYFVSTAVQETLMNALLKQIHNIPKSFNNSVGYTIKTDPPSRTMISLFNILTSPSKLVSLLHRRICVSTYILFVLVDPSNAQSWYLLGRAYMAGQKYNKAYEAYQQAVDNMAADVAVTTSTKALRNRFTPSLSR